MVLIAMISFKEDKIRYKSMDFSNIKSTEKYVHDLGALNVS